MLRGALAAAVTPLREEGAALDEQAFRPYLEFLAAAGLDGVLALGTTGEGILLSAAERRRAAELFLEGPLPVIVHCGAQTTAETSSLAEHAAAGGAAGVAVISPPYFALDDDALLTHLAAAKWRRQSNQALPIWGNKLHKIIRRNCSRQCHYCQKSKYSNELFHL